MRFFYFDTSVLVKGYIWEAGTSDVHEVLRELRAEPPTARVLASRIAYPEAMSAVSRREHSGRLTEGEADEITRRLLADFTGPVRPYIIIDPAPRLLHYAAELTRQYRLRTMDAVHLATALVTRYSLPDGAELLFGSADQKLNAAAQSESLEIFIPQTPAPTELGTAVAPSV